MLHISAFRFIGRGHAQRVLRRKRAPFHNRYDSFIGDQRERLNAIMRNIRYEKDAAARALLGTNTQLANLFSPEEAKQLVDTDGANNADTPAPSTLPNAEVNEAYRIHRLLRPDAPNFFEEQSFIHLKQKMDKLINESHSESFKELVPSDFSLDIDALGESDFSDDTYALSMYALMHSLKEDMRRVCTLLGLDGSKGDPMTVMNDFLGLYRDGSNVEHWANKVWPKVKPLMAEEFSSVSPEDVQIWLKSHLERVKHNRGVLGRHNFSNWYDIKRDLPYDGVPYPEGLVDERRVGYPLDKAPEYVLGMLKLFNQSMVGCITQEQLEEFICALCRIGLKDWFGLKENDILSAFFGTECPDDMQASLSDISLSKSTYKSCKYVMDIFLEGREHELDVECLSPASIFSSLGSKGMDIGSNPESGTSTRVSVLSQEDASAIISSYIKELGKLNVNKIVRDYNTVFDRMITDELEFQSSVGAGSVSEGEINYKVPAGAQFDPKRNYYVRTREGVDPTLKLENLRSCVLDKRRMRTMTKEGRVYFLRVVVAVGDGRGYFGTGVGFGNDIGTARGSAVQQALRNMYFIDFDPKEPLTTPVLGREYGSKVYITPRKMGSGIKANRKYLPLVYLTGLDNCKVTFHGRSSWITRMKALRKALEQIYSRRTMCNATGMRYVYVDKPGDHTVHWPDRWFIPLSKEYTEKIAALKNLKRIKFPRHTHRIVMPEEVKPEIPRYARHRFRSPLELREHDRKREQYISNKVKNMPLSPPIQQQSALQPPIGIDAH